MREITFMGTTFELRLGSQEQKPFLCALGINETMFEHMKGFLEIREDCRIDVSESHPTVQGRG